MSKQKLKESILADLKTKILTGYYKTGEKLPTERKLAEEYGTSRMPVHEAIAELVKLGVAKAYPGSGTVITSSGNTLGGNLGDDMEDIHPILAESIKLRKLIEAEAARQAAINRTNEDIKNIQNTLFSSINEIRKLKVNEDNSFFEADINFHKAIAEAAHNEFFIRCMNAIPNTLAVHQFISLKNTEPRDEVVSYHTQIYESILDGNGEKAYMTMYNHLNRVEKLILRDPDRNDVTEIDD